MNLAADRVAPFYAVEINRLANARERAIVEAKHHHAHLVLNQPRDGSLLQSAGAAAAG